MLRSGKNNAYTLKVRLSLFNPPASHSFPSSVILLPILLPCDSYPHRRPSFVRRARKTSALPHYYADAVLKNVSVAALQGHAIKNKDLLVASGAVTLKGSEGISDLVDDVKVAVRHLQRREDKKHAEYFSAFPSSPFFGCLMLVRCMPAIIRFTTIAQPHA